MKTCIAWFRNDPRLHDNRMLRRAIEWGHRLLCVYIHDSKHDEYTRWGFPRMGRHRRIFLADTLRDLDAALTRLGHRLWLGYGRPSEVLPRLSQTLGATSIVCERIAAPEEEQDVGKVRAAGVDVQAIWQSSLLDPDNLSFDVSSLPQVFSAFRKRVEAEGIQPPRAEPAPSELPVPITALPEWIRIDQILNGVTAASDERSSFPYGQPKCRGGKSAALAHVARYFSGAAAQRYKETRNGLIGIDHSTKFSPWLATGSLSPRTLFGALKSHEAAWGANESTYWIWFELLWRDYFEISTPATRLVSLPRDRAHSTVDASAR